METELAALLQSLHAANPDQRHLTAACDRLLKAAKNSPQPQRDQAISRLAPIILHENLPVAATAATICGSLVEIGANPQPMAEPLLKQLTPALEHLATRPLPIDDPPEPEALEIEPPIAPPPPAAKTGFFRATWNFLVSLYRLRRAMKNADEEAARIPEDPDEARIHCLGKGAIAMFTASPALRAAHPEIRALSEHLTQTNELCYWLETAFSVLDNEPILVLHPTERTGILAKISGVDVNFALNMLLMRDFPGAATPRLSPKAAAVLNGGPQQACDIVTGCWNLYNYTALDAEGRLPTGQSDTDHWIWNEGKPSDIAVFEGRRVILLGPPAYPRTWPAQRTFAAMIPKLEIESVLKPKEVDKWITRLTHASR